MTLTHGTTAVVIGASIAGLLAARALSDYYEKVVVLDRDRLPDDPVARSGVPHMRHSHALLAKGREAMEDLLPGLTAELVDQGALLRDVQEEPTFHVGGLPLATARSGLLALGVSRPLLEWQVRRRVEALPGVELRDRTSVLDLVFNEAKTAVTGVSVSHMDGPGTCETIKADLVVDASGRTGRTVEWLERRGYAGPAEEHHRVDVVYATRQFEAPPGTAGPGAVLQPVSQEVPRSAVMLPQEGGRWTVSIAGYHGERPPTSLAEFTAYARSVPGPLADVLDTLWPLDDGLTYRFPANVRRRYEKLRRFPDGLLVAGDAMCAFDPAFGQGMTVATLEAWELHGCLRTGSANLAQRYFRRAAAHIDTPWTITVGRDLQLPGSPEGAPLATRLVNRYIAALLRAAVDDAVLATAFLRVSHLAARPPSLMAPRYAVRVLRASMRGPRVAAPRPTRAAAPAHVRPHSGRVAQ
jgi:2-polyprenyl-6-methoxyphenol hydroxylase-like FAD-dependent oxidoreductase